MAEDNLFTEVPADTNIDPEKDWLSELVGEGKTYKDPAALARAVAEKEAFIERLKSENAGLRTEVNTRVTLEEFMDKVNSRREAPVETVEQPETPPSGLTEADAQRLIDDRLKAAREADRRKANSNFVKKELEKQYGKGYLNVLRAKSDELGLSTDQMSELAATAPQAFIAMVGKTTQNVPGFTPPAGVNTTGSLNAPQQKGWSYYENLRKKDPRLYWSPKVQNELHREAQRQGMDFLNT